MAGAGRPWSFGHKHGFDYAGNDRGCVDILCALVITSFVLVFAAYISRRTLPSG